MSLKHGLLGLLNKESMTGYQLDKVFKESLNFFWQVQTSQVYRELNSIEKFGWVTSEFIFQSDKPNKKVYSITEEGKKELRNWLYKNDISENLTIKNAFLMKIFFSEEKSAKENIQYLTNYKKKCEEALYNISDINLDYKEAKNSNNKMDTICWKATANYGKYYYEMCIKWADDVIKALEENV